MKKLLFALILTGSLTGCQVENINYTVPIMSTNEPQNVMSTSATLGGVSFTSGGSKTTEYGIVYSTNNEPTINDHKIIAGEGTGEFSNNYDVFAASNTYYYRTYGINKTGVGYGETYNFTTQAQAPCNPQVDNFIDTDKYTMNIDYVNINDYPYDGSLEFETSTNNRSTSIHLAFNEINGAHPKSGQYEVVSDIDNTPQSDSKVMILVRGYLGWEMASARAVNGSTLHVINNNGEITFIFCDMQMTDYYILNGKFTYTP